VPVAFVHLYLHVARSILAVYHEGLAHALTPCSDRVLTPSLFPLCRSGCENMTFPSTAGTTASMFSTGL
jgi:hypothetical protein